jgi:hypothetical protein
VTHRQHRAVLLELRGPGLSRERALTESLRRARRLNTWLVKIRNDPFFSGTFDTKQLSGETTRRIVLD